MPDTSTTVGDLTAAFLEACGVETAFGVISIHNMPILDAFGRRNRTRFVPARGEAGALNMADTYARISGGLGVGGGHGGTHEAGSKNEVHDFVGFIVFNDEARVLGGFSQIQKCAITFAQGCTWLILSHFQFLSK